MQINGKRVYLRALEEKDCDMLLKLINDPETERMLCGYSFPVSSDVQKDWLVNKANGKNVFRCAVAPFDADDVAVGTVMLSDIDEKNGTAEIHIKMDADKGRGKGYGMEAINALVEYGFSELRLHCIYANVLEHNQSSQRLLEKCNFSYEGLLQSRVFKDGQYINICSYAILNTKY